MEPGKRAGQSPTWEQPRAFVPELQFTLRTEKAPAAGEWQGCEVLGSQELPSKAAF